MRICFVSTEFLKKGKASTGLPNYLYRVSKALQEMGHEPIILTIGEVNEHVFYDGIEVYRKSSILNTVSRNAGIQYIINSLEQSFLLNKEIKIIHKEKPLDIIQFTSLYGLAIFYYKKIPAIIRLSSYSKKYFENSTVYSSVEIKIQSWIERIAAKRVNAIISPSNVMAKEYGTDVKRKVTVIETLYYRENLIYNLEMYNREFKDKKYILFFGSLYDNKGIFVISKMIKRFLDKNPDYYFGFIGGIAAIENRNPLRELLKEAGPQKERIIYMPEMDHKSLYPIIEKAEFVVLPSLMENFSNACIEAMSLGKIVIGTDGTSFEQMIVDGYNGFLSKPGNSDSLYDKVQEAIELSQEQKKIMVRRALTRVNKLKPEVTVQRLVDYYNYIIDGLN